MSLKYSLYETPVPNGRENKKTEKHARVKPQGTKDTDFLCNLISQSSSFSSADVKGILEALTSWMGFYLGEGNSVELEGLGHFSPTLKTKEYIDENGRSQLDIQIDTVSYRCSPTLKKEIRKARLEEIKRENTNKLISSQRKENILWYVQKNISINCKICMEINNCTRYTALEDLKELVAEQQLLQTGKGKQRMYLLPYPVSDRSAFDRSASYNPPSEKTIPDDPTSERGE